MIDVEGRLPWEAVSKVRSLLSLVLTVLALGGLMDGCGASGSTAQAGRGRPSAGSGNRPAAVTANGHSGGLLAKLTQAQIGSTFQFELTASVRHALGALGYQLRYGDGTSTENVVPQFCVAGRGAPMRQVWHLSHRYKAAGRYHISASVYVNCTGDHAMATMAVDVR